MKPPCFGGLNLLVLPSDSKALLQLCLVAMLAAARMSTDLVGMVMVLSLFLPKAVITEGIHTMFRRTLWFLLNKFGHFLL